jgi:hypothetical protein
MVLEEATSGIPARGRFAVHGKNDRSINSNSTCFRATGLSILTQLASEPLSLRTYGCASD